MAFTATQKAQIRFYLGYQERYIRYYPLLEAQLADGSLTVETETLITASLTASPAGILASLIDIDAKIVAAHKRLKALKVGSIELPAKGEIMMLRSEGRRLVSRLAGIFGVDVTYDVFSDAPPGAGVGGGVIPLG